MKRYSLFMHRFKKTVVYNMDRPMSCYLIKLFSQTVKIALIPDGEIHSNWIDSRASVSWLSPI